MVLHGPMAEAEVLALCERLGSLLDASRAEWIDCDCSALVEGDLPTIDALARLQLTAARHGSTLNLRGVPPSLVELVAFAGLARILRLSVEVVRQTEHREEALGVQEEGDAADPIA
jgi:ABC-type transporter Mla MlaB component